MSVLIKNLSVAFGSHEVLKGIGLAIHGGEFISLLGSSGSGKTTLLKSIAGLVETQAGEIWVNDRQLDGLAPQDRHLSYVFQDLRLFPHLDVFQNIAFPLKMNGVDKKDWDKRIDQLLSEVHMTDYKHVPIQSLSGGQQQRIALARALAIQPDLLLLDEPFSGLDESLRFDMGQLIKGLHQDHGLTVIMVTHDKDEAIQFSDRIAILHHGRIHQFDSPDRLLYQPDDLFTAHYFGQVNQIPGQIDGNTYRTLNQAWLLPDPLEDREHRVAIFRPVDGRLVDDRSKDSSDLLFKVKVKATYPSTQQILLELEAFEGQEEWLIPIANSQDNYKRAWVGEAFDLAVNPADLSYVRPETYQPFS